MKGVGGDSVSGVRGMRGKRVERGRDMIGEE